MPKTKKISQFKLENFDKYIKRDESIKSLNTFKKTSLSPKQPFNGLLIGTTGTGKTSVVLNMIFKDFLEFDVLMIFTKELAEPAYQYIINQFPPDNVMNLDEQSGEGDCSDSDEYTDLEDKQLLVSENIANLPDLNTLDEDKHYLVVIDDMVNETNSSHKAVKDYYIRGRKHNVSTLYLTQSYFKVPPIIRDNSKVFMFFKTDNRRKLMELAKTFANDMDKEKFIKMFQQATSKPFNFFYIDVREENLSLKYRQNFDMLFAQPS